MKTGSGEHPKILKLARLLRVERLLAIGISGRLWTWTAEQCATGAIGHVDNEEIATSLYWLGDPDQLVGALVACGLVDESPTYRLVVHDWAEHCPRFIKQRLERSGKAFAVAATPNSSAAPNGAERRETGALPKPIPKPIPHTHPVCVGVAGAEKLADAFWHAMGRHARRTPSDLARAGELIDRFGLEALLACVPKVADAVKRRFPQCQSLGGAMVYFEECIASKVKTLDVAKQREAEAERRRQEAEAGERKRKEREQSIDRGKRKWQTLTEAERQEYRRRAQEQYGLLVAGKPERLELYAWELLALEESNQHGHRKRKPERGQRRDHPENQAVRPGPGALVDAVAEAGNIAGSSTRNTCEGGPADAADSTRRGAGGRPDLARA